MSTLYEDITEFRARWFELWAEIAKAWRWQSLERAFREKAAFEWRVLENYRRDMRRW
jgi:hypothetical protein